MNITRQEWQEATIWSIVLTSDVVDRCKSRVVKDRFSDRAMTLLSLRHIHLTKMTLWTIPLTPPSTKEGIRNWIF